VTEVSAPPVADPLPPPRPATADPSQSGPPQPTGTGFRPPAWVLIGACAGVPLVFTTRSSDVFYLPKLLVLWGLLVLSLWLVVFELRSRRIGFRAVALVDVPVAAFFVLNVLAVAFSVDWRQSLVGEHLQYQGLLSLTLYLGFFYLARLAIVTVDRLTALFGAITLGAAVVSLYAIAQRLGIDPIWKGYLPSGRVFSTIGQPNALAAYLVLVVPIGVTLAVQLGGLRRVACCVAVAVSLAALMLTYSRGGYAGLVVALVVLGTGWLLWRRPTARDTDATGEVRPRVRRGVTIAVVVPAAALVLGVALASPLGHEVRQAWQRANSVTQLSGDESISNHLDQWKVAVRIVEDHPLLGTGPETFPEEFPAYSRLVLPPAHVRYFDQFRVESPHDEVLAVAAGAGIPSAAAYLFTLLAVAAVLVRGIRTAPSSRLRLLLLAILAAMAGHVVTDAFMSAEVTGSWMVWTLLGAGVATAVTARSRPSTGTARTGTR
jgi:putative inorganic carbon (HCO3(-)) transporter